jgi:hypothetical protein
MHSGIFARRSPGAKPQVQSEEDDLFTKEGIQWRQAFLDNQDPNEADDRSSFLTDLVNFAKHDAIKMAYHFVESIQGTNRFLGFDLEPYRFAYLSLDPSIERAFIDQLCSISSIHRKEGQVVPPPHALAIKIDAEPAPPFLDVVKTLLLDQFSATEDKLDRITKKYHDFFKLRIKQMTKPPSSV